MRMVNYMNKLTILMDFLIFFKLISHTILKKNILCEETANSSPEYLIWWLTLASHLWKHIKLFTDAQGLHKSIHQ